MIAALEQSHGGSTRADRYCLRTLHRLSRHCTDNRALILRSHVVGCVVCGGVFSPLAIRQWWDADAIGIAHTAVCPSCGMAMVIGDAAGVQISRPLLSALHDHVFWILTG